MPTNMRVDELEPFLDIFQCIRVDFPIKYLGLPLHSEKLRREDLQPLVDSMLARIVDGEASYFLCWAKVNFN